MSQSDEIKERIRERVSLVDLITESGVEVKRAGRRFTALCPFHSEKTPSFSINEDEGFYKCFGCGKAGDCYTYLMEKRGFEFPEALRFLANRVGVEIPDVYDRREHRANETRDVRSVMRRVCRVAQELYHSTLLRTPEALRYVEERGLTKETIETFRLGYAPGRSDAANGFLLPNCEEILKGEVPQLESLLQQAGLRTRKEQNRSAHDFFRDRIIFPIQRSDGAPIAFGGRIMTAATNAPKYLNTPESPVYQKRKTFYGMYQAHDAMRGSRTVIIVEGYMDVIALHQAGVRNVLATCGTSLTEEHAGLLRRVVDRVVLLFDGDAAGQKAAGQSFDRFLNSGLAVEAVLLPDNHDPDSYVRKSGESGLRALIAERKRPILEVYVDFLLRSVDGVSSDAPSATDAAVRGKVAVRVAHAIAAVVNPVEREVLVQTAAQYLGVTAESINSLVAGKLRQLGPEKAFGGAFEAAAPRRENRSQERPNARFGSERSDFQRYGPDRYSAGTARRDTRNSREQPENRAAANSTAGRSSQETLKEYHRQLLVAVISQPVLAQHLLSMPSFLAAMSGGAGFKPEGVNTLDEADGAFAVAGFEGAGIDGSTAGKNGVYGELPQTVRAVLGELSDGTYSGLQMAVDVPESDPMFVEELTRLKTLLTKHGLAATELCQEAIRQLKIGGAKPENVVADAGLASARTALKVEVHQLQVEESAVNDAAGKLRLAQEKLLKRRNLDRLGTRNERE